MADENKQNVGAANLQDEGTELKSEVEQAKRAEEQKSSG